jgi:hypothetical protein
MMQPTRPHNVIWVERPQDDAPQGVVLEYTDGRFVLLPIDPVAGTSDETKARFLPNFRIETAQRDPFGVLSLHPRDVTEPGEKVGPEIQKWVKTALCPPKNNVGTAPTPM